MNVDGRHAGQHTKGDRKMKSGKSLVEIATELMRQTETRKDYIAPQGNIQAIVKEGEVMIDGINGNPFPVQRHAHGQLATHLGIPAKYYDRMKAEQPELLAANVNTWFSADGENKRMVRTLDGRVRAFLSPKYRPLDNFDLAETVLPTLTQLNAQIMSAELTETRMYIKAILPSLSDELPEGMTYGGHNRIGGDRGHVVAAIVIANSEVGAGTLRIEPSVYTTRCTNLMILAEAAMKKYHVGRAFDADASYEVFRDATRQADDRAFFMKVKDITAAAFNEEIFRKAIAEIRKTAEVPIVSKELPKVVEVAVRRLALPQGTQGSILTHLAGGGDLTQWGLSSAITRTANDFDDYEGATDLERAGGELLALPAREWEAISNAA